MNIVGKSRIQFWIEPDREWTAGSPDCQEWQVLDLVIRWGTEADHLGTVWETICQVQKSQFDFRRASIKCLFLDLPRLSTIL